MNGVLSLAMLVALAAFAPHGLHAAGAAPGPPRTSWIAASQEDGGDDSLRVTTHTREHCAKLAAHATQLREAHKEPQREAEVLAREGERLCAHGQIRPGIIRLRRAIMLLHPDSHAGPKR